MKTFFNVIRKAETFATVMFMMMFTVAGLLQVFFRLVLRSPLSWSEEACRYLFIWSTMLGAVLVSSENGHFKVDFLIEIFPRTLRLACRMLSYILILVFSLILIRYGYTLMMANTVRTSPALGIKTTYIYSIFLINGMLVVLHLFETVYNDLANLRGGTKL